MLRYFAFVAGLTLVASSADFMHRFSGDMPTRIIDAHAHWDDDARGDQPSEKMIQEYQEVGVVGAVIHSSQDGREPNYRKSDRLKVALCASTAPKSSRASVEAGLKSGKFNCLKVYLGYIPIWANDPYYHHFYRLAREYDVPVIFHTGDTYDKMAPVKYADPLTIDDVAIKYPDVRFLIAHMGNPWIQSAAEVVYKNDNVSVDLSALMLGNLDEANPEAVEELLVKPIKWFSLFVENPKKLMFGTDRPIVNVKSYINAVKRAIPRDQWDAVFYQNAYDFFGFDQR